MTAVVAAVVGVALVAAACSSTPATHAKQNPGGGSIGVSNQPGATSVRPNVNAAPLRVVSISPSSGSRNVDYASDITVRFSEPLAANSALPRLSPLPPGTWVLHGASVLVFHPRGNYVPFATEKLTLPGGVHGLLGQNGGILPRSLKANFKVRAGSELRLQQLLAELGYLPLEFVPSSAPQESEPSLSSDESSSARSTTTTTTVAKSTTTTTTAAPTTTTTAGPTTTTTTRPSTSTSSSTTTTTAPPPTTQPSPPSTIAGPGAAPTHVHEPLVGSAIPLTPQPGKFVWRFKHNPASLTSLWSTGKGNVITRGAIMQFEANHGLATDGIAGPSVWGDLLLAVAHRQVDKTPYAYVYVSTALPETLTLWVNGKIIFQTPCNTGIPEAPTAAGTYPVYARYVTTTMSGTNPDGSHYSDPGIPWVSYFNGGDALHGFLRASYGYPQSLGCVEMPYQSAGTVYPWTPIGTLVTVE